MLRAEDYRDLAAIIGDHHTALLVALFGEEAAPAEWIESARKLGLLKPTTYHGTISAAYQIGMLQAALGGDPSAIAGMSLAGLKERLRAAPVPQTPWEAAGARQAALRGAQAVQGLGNKVGATLGSALIEADARLRDQMREVIRDATAAKFGDADAMTRMKQRGIDKGLTPEFFEGAFREEVRRLASDIGHATDDWTRDLQRIAQTESHTAMQQGMGEHWQATVPGRVLVYRSIRPTACRYCVALYMDGGNPRIFDLDKLMANGPNNVGRKAAEWLPVNGSTHPFCSCSSVRLPRFTRLPPGWHHGDAAPTVVGAEGLVA